VRRLLIVGLTLGVATVGALTASARPAADDVSLDIFLRAGNLVTETRGPNFQIVAEVSAETGVRQSVTMTVTLPPGLDWGRDGPDPSEGCSGTRPAVCRLPLEPNPAGTIGVGWVWDVVSQAPGTYEISGRVDPDEADPNATNNTDVFRVQVLAAAPEGGGEGGGGGGSATTSASAVKLSPARPRAGSTLVASVRVTRGGSPVKPTGVACAATVGKTKIRGGVRSSSGVASCLFKTPKSGKGKTMVGSVSFRAGGQSFQRRFVSRLG
jgi:hypothetical protein